jgi:guanosine-3',5'-bis(diphosphate) 3'-pyrophosphohydrolase
MGESLESTYRPLLEAVAFAARAHRGQLRKDRETPYFSHVFRVCLIVRHVFGIDDHKVLMAAALHDTVEDTTTDYDDLYEHFGKDVADWVATLSKDKRLLERPREAAYEAGLAKAPWQVKVCKLADIFDNLLDSQHMRPEQRAKVFHRAHAYLQALNSQLPDRAKGPYEIVSRLLAELESSEAR